MGYSKGYVFSDTVSMPSEQSTFSTYLGVFKSTCKILRNTSTIAF